MTRRHKGNTEIDRPPPPLADEFNLRCQEELQAVLDGGGNGTELSVPRGVAQPATSCGDEEFKIR